MPVEKLAVETKTKLGISDTVDVESLRTRVRELEELVARSREENANLRQAAAARPTASVQPAAGAITRPPGDRTFSILRKAGFHWSFEEIAHKDRITCPGSGRYPDACFDYFFTLGLGKPLSTVVKARSSDQLSVVMEVQVK